MPSKVQPDVNLWFLYVCLQKSDYKTIDFHAVSKATNSSPSAVRRRFARLKKQIEKNSSSDTAKKTPAASEPATRGAEKPAKDPQTDSEATGSKQLTKATSQGAARENAQTQALSCRVEGQASNGGRPVHIDLTEEPDGKGGVNADDSSDDDAPLMKKRRMVGVSSVWRRTVNYEPVSVKSDDKNPDFSSQTGDGHFNQSLSPAQRVGAVNGHERSNEEQRGIEHEAAIVGGASVASAQRTSEPQMVDLTGEEPPAWNNTGAGGISNANTVRPSSVEESPGGNGLDVLPASFSEQDIYLFGDELFNSFLGPDSDLRSVDILDGYDAIATGWQQQTSHSPLGPHVSPLVSRRESFISIDERPAYSWALRRLDQPDLAVLDQSY
ncbi:hypothetical protein VTN77DRAFT_8246 [Rasamsonia byssochlamydoides]|uniref:uncharacterized protein n=1 Tax=Rasamsonia byssochlamydoides TaxID=89139 RepID=UPI00374327CF